MRLTDYERSVIFSAITAEDANAKVFLFGSRTNDSAKGGDIDLLVLSNTFNRQKLRAARWKIQEQLGEQKIDIITSTDGNEPFVKLIQPTAEELTL